MAQDLSSTSTIYYESSSSYISPSDAAAASTSSTPPPPPPPPPPASTSTEIPETVVTSVAYVTVTSYIVDPGAATPSSSIDLTVTVDSYLPESTSTWVTQYYNGTSTSTTTIWWTPSSSTSTIWWTPSPIPSSTTTWDGSNPGQGQGQSSWTSPSSWDSQHSQYTSHDHGPPSPTSTTTVFALPQSTDASEYLHHVFPPTAAQPTWATGSFYTQLASALYAVDRSFAGRDDYATIVAAISHAGDADSPQVSASIAQSAWGWAAVTTNGWYQSDVPAPVKTDVAQYIDAWHNAEFSVLDDAQKAEATATGGRSGGGGGSGGGKGGGGPGGGSAATSEGASLPGRGGVRIMVGVVAGLLVGTIGLL